MKLKGKTTLVTGAASGIGLATAIRFARAGSRVIGLDKKPQVSALCGFHAGMTGIVCDLADVDQLTMTLHDILRDQPIDILVNNAGINPSPAPITETEQSTWEAILASNLTSIYHLSRLVVPTMQQGVVINISSILGIVGARKNAAYAASKGAIIALTRAMAKDHGPQIRVNCICPGAVQTEMFDDYLRRCAVPDAEKNRIIDAIPLKRLGTPEDVAAAALFLASDEASWITGITLVVDGGDSA